MSTCIPFDICIMFYNIIVIVIRQIFDHQLLETLKLTTTGIRQTAFTVGHDDVMSYGGQT